MKLEGDKIYLKPFTKKYAADWVRWTQDEEVTRYSVMRPYTLEEELKYLEERKKTKPKDLIFSIFLKENGKIIGNCGIHQHDEKFPGKVSVGLMIGEKTEWGKGYGTDTIKILLNYIKKKIGAGEVFLNVDIPNAAAIRCYEKCGFKIIRKEKAPERKNSGGEHYIMRAKL